MDPDTMFISVYNTTIAKIGVMFEMINDEDKERGARQTPGLLSKTVT
jgi:hypothetical protein